MKDKNELKDAVKEIVDKGNTKITAVKKGRNNVVFTEKEVENFIQYILGASELPNNIGRVVYDLTDKLAIALGFSIANNTRRQAQLQKFIEKLEINLFDEDKLDELTNKEKIELYDKATKALSELYETQRKYVMQSQEIQMAKTPQEQLLGKLLNLSDDDLNKVINGIEETVNKEEKTVNIPFTEGVEIKKDKNKINLNE